MADMGEGFDKLVSKLQQAVNFAEKLDKTMGNISRSAGAAGDAVAGGASAGASGAPKGGNKNLGGGKNVMANSFGSTPYDSPRLDKTNPKFASKVERLSDIGSPTMDNGKQAFGKMGKAMGRMTGMAQFEYDPSGGAGGQMMELQKIKRANQAQMDKVKKGYLGMHGVSMSRFSTMAPEAQANITSSMYGLGDSLSLMSGLSNAMNTMMPSVQSTMDRVAGYYNAGTMSGRTRGDVQANTFGTLSKIGGMTSIGSDANVAQYLTGRGMAPNGGAGSTYQQTLTSVANAGRYQNIANEDAARSVEGMTSASGAASTLQNFGIYTADIRTGKEKTQEQIFEEVAQRLTAGRGNASLAQTQASIRRGALGVTADAFFTDETTNKMFKQFMVDRAQPGVDVSGGKVGDSSNPQKRANPLLSQMTMNASDTGVMNAAQDNYIKGVNMATVALQGLNGVVAGLAQTFAGAGSAMTQTLFGAGSVKGIAGGMSTTVNFLGKAASGIGEAFMGMDALNPAPALTQMGIIAGSAGLSMGAAVAGLAGAGFAASFGGGNAGGSGRMTTSSSNGGGLGNGGSGSSVNTNSLAGIENASKGGNLVNLFSMNELATHKINRGVGGGHKGYDLAYSKGDKVYSIGDGVVIAAINTFNHQVYAASWEDVGNNIGNYVAIKHTAANGDVFTSLYGHLSQVLVSKDQTVLKGTLIGKAGNTGSTWPMEKNGDGGGSHLHFELQKGEKRITGLGTSLDPTQYADVKANPFTGPVVSGTDPGSLVGGNAPKPGEWSGNNGSGVMSGSGDYAGAAVSDASQQAKGMLSSIEGRAKGQLSILSNLYSNNPDKLKLATDAMAKSFGLSQEDLKYYNQEGSAGTYLPSQGAPSRGRLQQGNVNNNQTVNITVQVPDVTAADAVKFGQLVKQYLDDSSLISNMGSN
jgi:murein DD-endopeptidase MepM/ murein hydrolase activator NlpD